MTEYNQITNKEKELKPNMTKSNIKTKINKATSLTLATLMIASTLSPLKVLANPLVDTRGVEMEILNTEEGVSIEDKIPDENLKRAIREKLGVSVITDKNILNLTQLDVSKKENTPDSEKILDITGINYAKNLQIIDLSYNQIKSIDPAIFKDLTNLVSLSLDFNHLTTLDTTTFKGLTSLQDLHLSSNQLINLEPTIFEGLISLNKIDLYGNKLTNINPLTFKDLINLQALRISNNQLTSLDPVTFNGLTNLQRLDLGNNQLASLDPATFKDLTNLQELFIDKNQLTNLDTTIFKDLTNLQYLGLDNNQLTKLDQATINSLTNLQYLNLRNNQLTSLESTIFEGFTNLQELYLDTNHLTNINFIKNLNLTRNKDLSNQLIQHKMIKRVQELPTISNNPTFEKEDKTAKYKIEGNKIVLDDNYVGNTIYIRFTTDDVGKDEGKERKDFGFSGTIKLDTSDVKPTEAQKFRPEILPEIVIKGNPIDLTDNIKNLPNGAKIKDITNPAIDTNKVGNYIGRVEIIFADGSKRVIGIPVKVILKEENKQDTNIINNLINNNYNTTNNYNYNFNSYSYSSTERNNNVDQSLDNSYKIKQDNNQEEARRKQQRELDNIKADIERQRNLPNPEVRKLDYSISRYQRAGAKSFWIFKIGDLNYKFVTKDNVTTHTADVAPFIKNDRTFIPFRFVGYAINVDVKYDNNTRIGRFEKNGKNLEINIDTKKATKNGQPYNLEVAPMLVKDRLVAPVSVVGKAFNKTVSSINDNKNTDIIWNQATQEVIIYNYD